VIATPDRLQQRDAGGRHAQASAAQLLRDGRSRGCCHDAKLTCLNTNLSRQLTVQV
jgi:hypothetical protein